MVSFFKKKEVADTISARKNWYEDRYQSAMVQRNLLILLTFAALAGIVVSVLVVIEVTTSKSIEPFVIEIEEKTGVTNVIRPFEIEKLSQDEVLRRYFLVMYMTARESYNPNSYEYNYYKVVPLLSSRDVYSDFGIFLRKDENSPTKLGAGGYRTIKIKSITKLKDALQPKTNPNQEDKFKYTVQVRFLAQDYTIGRSDEPRKRHLQATVTFTYADFELTEDQRDINPLGFQVTGYTVDEEAAL